jgi:hypothetical protein
VYGFGVRIGVFAVCVFALGGCKRGEEGSSAVAAATGSAALVEAADEAVVMPRSDQKKGSARRAGERVTIPAGVFVAGSTPGDRGRDPTLEARELEVNLGEFVIDALPYPNDPARPPVTGLPRAKAHEACAQAGGRLCHELEWERACKGTEANEYAGGKAWEPECAKRPETCASGFGVLAMAGAMREWTSTDVEPLKGYRSVAAAAVRGSTSDAADVDHRCAHRMAVDGATSAGNLGFRCCYGAPPTVTIPVPELGPTVQKIEFSTERLASLFASNPKLKPFAEGLKFFRDEAGVGSALKRGKGCPESTPPTPSETLTTPPILWSPVPGEELLLVAGQSAGSRSFIVAFHRLSGDRYRVAAAMLMDDEPGPVVLAYNQNVRKKLEWSIGWQCPGESGNVTYRDEHRVTITQR